MSVISDIKMILESNNIHLLHDAKSYLEQIERWDAIKDADLVEVVRCKDCIHCADDWNGNQPMFTCEIGMCYESVEPNGYCFCGERREDVEG